MHLKLNEDGLGTMYEGREQWPIRLGYATRQHTPEVDIITFTVYIDNIADDIVPQRWEDSYEAL